MPAFDTAITFAIGIFGGGALLSFLQFLINRNDNKGKQYKDVITALNKLEANLDKLKSEIDEDRASNARIRILGFSDEIRHNLKHSKESFDQILSDIDMYEQYCKSHVTYKNSRAVAAISNIRRIYNDCLREESFLD